MNFDEIITRIIGLHMITAAIIGLSLNSFMFFHFSKLKKTSFYILCSSKCIANCMSLEIYLGYVGPVNLLYTQIGSSSFNSYLNQALGFGLLIQGPIIQCMIAMNRFLVVWIFPVSTPRYGIQITTAALTISWIFMAWFSTLIGLPDYCRVTFNFGHLEFINTLCNVEITWYLVYGLFGLAGSTNFLNILIAVKLFCSSKSKAMLSSEASQSRRKLSIRFFFQSCFQDWIIIMDFLNNLSSTKYCRSRVCVHVVIMGFDVMIYGMDGLVMYLFNRKASPSKRMGSRVKTTTSEFMKPNVSML
ncbi:hypothetical protein CAEBREN_01982 [Caenorhabditis brenneri]|uniref:7TM GPCR serpentine receptor class x (Srx) domain-containing protein n=1 Tax=Caenorhabditis brenneri TaxID=135651 RepID=G0MD74_CAEBE|nr:hypothetical protein CAEBREN_01982 [Caenorhabditis brenneri]